MQRLKLANNLFPNVVTGQKIHTVRRGKRHIELGPLVLESTDFGQEPGKFIELEVDVFAVIHTRLKTAGFCLYETAEGLKERLLPCYADITDDDEITAVYFRYKDGSG